MASKTNSPEILSTWEMYKYATNQMCDHFGLFLYINYCFRIRWTSWASYLCQNLLVTSTTAFPPTPLLNPPTQKQYLWAALSTHELFWQHLGTVHLSHTSIRQLNHLNSKNREKIFLPRKKVVFSHPAIWKYAFWAYFLFQSFLIQFLDPLYLILSRWIQKRYPQGHLMMRSMIYDFQN